jgi:DNA-binding NarL/FixJ family response regulator
MLRMIVAVATKSRTADNTDQESLDNVSIFLKKTNDLSIPHFLITAVAYRKPNYVFEKLGAGPAAEKLRQSLRATGVRGIPRGPRPSTKENPAGLTIRQAEVLTLMVDGLSNAEIADRLFISTRTVDHHVAAILDKLDARTRAEAVSVALQTGLLPN